MALLAAGAGDALAMQTHTVVLLGAGSSFGSSGILPERPPLGRDSSYGPGLFSELEKRSGIARTLPEPLKKIFRQDFEAGMALYHDAEQANINDLQIEIALLLSEYRVGPYSTFRRLLRLLGQKGTVYSTLNYDLLIERAAIQLGGFVYGIVDHPRFFRVAKLHGSCNFFPAVNVGRLVVRETPFAYVGPLKIIETTKTERALRGTRGISPAMAIYRDGKPYITESHDLWLQLQAWQDAVRSANRLFLLGISVNPADIHIWEPLGEGFGTLCYFGMQADEQPFISWCEDMGRRNAWFVEAPFDRSIAVIRNIKTGFFDPNSPARQIA